MVTRSPPSYHKRPRASTRPFFEEVEGHPEANFHSMAVRMVEALRGELRATEVRVEMLQQMGV